MRRIKILDCTLRDGGYVNDFFFGENAIKKIVQGLTDAHIDIIECGFLRTGESNKDKTVFGSMKSVSDVINKKNPKTMYVAMVQLGAINVDEIEPCSSQLIDGIRLTFHKHEVEQALVDGKKLMDKGYKVFIQPVGTTDYEDSYLLYLIEKVNLLHPYAFYIVDTLGTMYKNDLLRMFYLVDHNLNRNIALGFHSHNNLQMSFANAQELAQLNSTRNIIIDASILGMGRGAGNLNTELLAQYLNVNFSQHYSNLEIMSIVDEYIRPLKAVYKWGYDAAYYLAAVKGCHPNYSSFLLNLQTLSMQDIEIILNSMDEEKRSLYDECYIQSKYDNYMNHYVNDTKALEEIKKKIDGRDVVLLAPGKSLYDVPIPSENKYVISVNFVPENFNIDMIFVSNKKRYDGLQVAEKDYEVVLTSNIMDNRDNNNLVVNYFSYLNENQYIKDNAGLMCINMLVSIGVKNIMLAGFDGFSRNVQDNYIDNKLFLEVDSDRWLAMNAAMSERLEQLREKTQISYVSDSLYDR